MLTRRGFLAGVGAAAAACGARPRAAVSPASRRPDYLAYAREAATFIRSQAVETDHGLLWRKSPDEPGELRTDTYHGSPGPVIFFLEMFRATGDVAFLDDAERGMAQLIATTTELAPTWSVGLYGGIAGHGMLALALAETTDDARYHDHARRSVTLIESASVPHPQGGVHLDGTTEIFYGGAGVILWLLEVHRALDAAPALDLAVRHGDGLLALAQPTDHGRRWLWRPDMTYEMPNFAHGTAGVAYALARLYEVTRHERFLAAALAGAAHCLGLAYTAGDVCLVPHAHPGGGSERYYLGLCHGPAGTSRLFHQLARVTNDPQWREWWRRSIRGIQTSGVPEGRTPGFWDNVGRCCGSAALADALLWADDTALAHALVDDLLARATPAAGGGLEWVHAENRVEPYWRQSYTGWMQGASGIGSLLIRLAARERGADWNVRWPDNPVPAPAIS